MRLQTKIIISFASIVILMALLQTFFFKDRIEGNFEEYIRQVDYERIQFWQEFLAEYYRYNGSWDNVEILLIDNSMIGNGMRRGNIWSNDLIPARNMVNLQVVIADKQGIVIAAPDNYFIGKDVANVPGVREELFLEGEKIGELVFLKEKNAGFISMEQQFINSMRSSLILGSIITAIIAVIIGFIFSNRITKPLAGLMTGIRRLSAGDTTYRVKVKTKDEFQQLANAFNDMSQKIEENEKIRKGLVADVAHELRTPLSVLRGRLELIQEGTIEGNQEEIIRLNDEVLRLTRLVNDLQQLTLAEAGKLTLYKKEVNLKELVNRVIDNFNWLAEEKGIDIVLDSDNDVKVDIDYDRVTQVIINILGNSLRHTPDNGKVRIDVTMNNKDAIIKIKDNGPGIDEEHLPYIFERFYRTDASRSRDQGGTGLGLAIAKGYIESHKGNIAVESKKGEGTTFIISLPL